MWSKELEVVSIPARNKSIIEFLMVERPTLDSKGEFGSRVDSISSNMTSRKSRMLSLVGQNTAKLFATEQTSLYTRQGKMLNWDLWCLLSLNLEPTLLTISSVTTLHRNKAL